MSNKWKWNKFVDIGNNIHKMRGQLRILESKRALVFAKQLIDNEFIPNLPIEDQQLYDTLLPKIAACLDGNAEIIQTAVREYFLIQHCKAGFDENQFQVSYAPKKSGIQTGFTCDVSNETQTIRYYIKTHQHDQTEDNPKSVKRPDMKELFIYQFLNHIGIGPHVHFICPSHGSKMTIYIATKECHLTLLSQLTKDTVIMKALLQLDLISRILCLRDCTTNSSNCGLVKCKPMIVDFLIEKQSNGYVKLDIMDKFYEGNGEFNYTGLMSLAVGIPQEEKLCILKESLQEWNLLDNIDKTLLEMHSLIQKISTDDDDLQRYVQDVKTNIRILSQE